MAKEPKVLKIFSYIAALQNELNAHKVRFGFSWDELADGANISRVAIMHFAHTNPVAREMKLHVSTLVNIEAYLLAMRDETVRKARRATHPLKAVLTAWRAEQHLPADDDRPCDQEEEL